MPIDDERTHRGDDSFPAPAPSEQEVWLGLLVGQMPAVLWSLDCGLHFTSSLGAGLAALGLAADQVVGMHLHDYFQTDDLSVPSVAAHHRALAGESVTFELLLDDHGHLRLGAAPSLPESYGPEIEKFPSVASPESVARRILEAGGTPEPSFAGLRDLAVAYGSGACWTEPIRSGGGAALGILAIYRQGSQKPSAAEIQSVEGVAALAAIALEAARSRDLLLHHALHDPLTGLPNRTLFLDRLEMAMRRSRRRAAYTYAVLFVDLDGFKQINDSLGHMVGDELLRGIAGRLRRALRPGDTVARLGGDEFASRSSGSTTALWWASKRCCAGTTRSWACSCRSPS